MNKSMLLLILSVTLVVMLTTRCGDGEATKPISQSKITPTSNLPSPTSAATQTEPSLPAPGALLSTATSQPFPDEEKLQLLFASYLLEPVSAGPSLQQEPIDPQMGNVLVPLVLSAEQLERLGQDGVVASPADYPEFHFLYKETVNRNLPVFVTSDALLHAYHLVFDQLLSQLEEGVFLPYLRELNQSLMAQMQLEYDQLKGSSWEDPARRLYAYLAVGSKLADPDFQVPAVVEDLAQAELSLIEAASGPALSPTFPHLKYGEDYSQYVPRSHYTKSDALKAYFKAMMWYGRMTFRLNDPQDPAVDPDETRMALLLALTVRDAKAGARATLDLWQVLYDPTTFLVGRSDDLTILDYLQVMDAVYGPLPDLNTVADESRLQAFISATQGLPAPRILGLISDDYKPMEAVKGLRLMGQRFVVDAYIFQELIHPKAPERYLPSGLDVMAVLGSERAAAWLEQDPSTQHPKYASQFEKLTGWVAGLSQEDWVETSYNAWLYSLRPLLEPAGQGYPLFMQSTAWQDKQLNTALGSWAELKHDTLLYAKQAYGGLGAGGWPRPPAPVLAQNYVEPVPEVFARIAALASMTRQGLEDRGLIELIPKQDEYAFSLGDRLDSIASKALQLKAIAESELKGQPLADLDEYTLRSFGEYLEELVTWANGDKEELEPAAIIADVATDPNKGEVLEVGIGNVHEVYVVAPIPQADGSLALTVARGGIFSYYDFPSKERLTDEAWREMVQAGETPEQPPFTSGFSVPQAARLDIQAAIYRFQRNWANWIYLTVGYEGGEDSGPIRPGFDVPVHERVLQQAEQAITTLRAKNQYEGRQWLKTDYLSVRPAADAPQNVIVTVRETWKDYLVIYEGDNAFTWYNEAQEEPISARRGPYTIDVLYELEPWENTCVRVFMNLECYPWRVVRFEELTERPGWETP
jgi:hypothetical protein